MKIASKIYMGLAFLLLYFPIAVMIVYSFNGTDSTGVLGDFPSVRWYAELFRDGRTLSALGNTLVIAVLAAVLSTLVGTAAAVGIVKMRNKRFRNAVQTVTNIPMMNPEIVTGISLMLLFVFVGTLFSAAEKLNFWTLLLAHVTFCLPYVVLSVIPKLNQLDRSLSEAAQDLGCTPLRAFFQVELPAILPGVITGMIMAFTLSLDDFVISYFTAGSTYETLPIRIFSMTKKRVKPDMYALSTLIFLFILILLLVSNLMGKDENKQKRSKVRNRRRERILKFVACGLIAAALLTGIAVKIVTYDPTHLTLNVYNNGEYIADGSEGSMDVVKEFEDWYYETYNIRVTVNYTTYANNEDMYAKLKGGASDYDVVFPSDYMLERMIKEGMVAELDYSKIPNAADVDPRYDIPELHPYATPYTVGMVGLIYNAALVEEMGKEPPTAWSAMWDPDYAGKILTFNNPRDAFAIAQYYLGRENTDLNSEDPATWEAALEALRIQKKGIQSYVNDEVYNKMENGEAILAPYYAGDFLTMYDNNEDLAFVYPEEGTNFFIDYMCIPATSTKQELANEFINFMQRTDIATANANYIAYASPLQSVVTNPDYDYSEENDPDCYAVLYGAEETYPTQMFHRLDDPIQTLMNRLWDSLKTQSDSNASSYIGTAVILTAILGTAVFVRIRKKKREAKY